MRLVSLVLVCAACGGSGDGAVLSFTAPDGPVGASRIELVLASADSSAMTATRQRMRPRATTTEEVVYFRQRSTVDSIVGIDAIDGFEVRIEPDEDLVSDETFIPFALIYDDANALIAVGTVNDAESGAPIPVIVRPGTVASYDVTVIKLAPDSDAAGIAVGQGHVVTCKSDSGSWPSGVVWKPASGPQIRLLFPDVTEDPMATDAMLRASDLDCDDHRADSGDCDDLRTAYHSGQTETCDGDDTDCDGRPFELIRGCQVPSGTTCVAPGVSLCAEASNEPPRPGTCEPSAACSCALVNGTTPVRCSACALTWVTGSSSPGSGGAAPCAPSIGEVHFDQCDAPGCTVDVVGTDGQWEIKIGPDSIGPFSSQLTDVTTGQYYVRAKYLGTAVFPTSSTTIGGVYMAIRGPLRAPSIMPINLELEESVLAQCAVDPTGNNVMRCYP
ncbi:MAG: hypothetical protein H0T42_19425 [Deltaproteobacteria bacterium]|nr:hypothetical protein [Deltaproteobacteria bacterium]